MASHKIKIQYAGREADAVPMEVNQSSEKWNEYFLEDGSIVKMKLVLKKVLKVENEYDGEGNPVYVMQSTNVTSVSAPKNLKKSD